MICHQNCEKRFSSQQKGLWRIVTNQFNTRYMCHGLQQINKTILTISNIYITSEIFREFSHLQGAVNTHEKLHLHYILDIVKIVLFICQIRLSFLHGFHCYITNKISLVYSYKCIMHKQGRSSTKIVVGKVSNKCRSPWFTHGENFRMALNGSNGFEIFGFFPEHF